MNGIPMATSMSMLSLSKAVELKAMPLFPQCRANASCISRLISS